MSPRALRIVVGVLVALAAAAVVASYVGTLALQREIACQAAYAQAFREAVEARDAAAAAEREAQRRLLANVSEPGSTDPGVFRRYLAALAASDARRAAAPLPPDDYCQPKALV
jgi:type II secretory pathway pseudopilin PulG